MSGISTDEEDESPRLKEEQGIISKGNSPARNTQQPDSDRKSVVAMSASDDRRQGKVSLDDADFLHINASNQIVWLFSSVNFDNLFYTP